MVPPLVSSEWLQIGTNADTIYGPMSGSTNGVIEDDRVIVAPKKTPEQVKFRWPPDLIEEVREIAKRTGRTMNEAGEMMMRWAVERAKHELEAAEPREKPRK